MSGGEAAGPRLAAVGDSESDSEVPTELTSTRCLRTPLLCIQNKLRALAEPLARKLSTMRAG